MGEYRNYIGKYIAKQRTDMGMPLREMAKILGITPIKLNDIELGNCLPDVELLQLMEKRIGIQVSSCIEFLINWQSKKEKKSTKVKKEVPKVQVCYNKDSDLRYMF